MQDRKRDTDVQNRLLDSMGEGEGGMIWEYSDDLNVDWSVTKTILHQVLTHWVLSSYFWVSVFRNLSLLLY